MKASRSTTSNKFADDVLAGLTSEPKSLSSRYFYDDEGSRLFMEIMKLPEYYLTRSEMEIFTEQTADIYKAFSDGAESFDLIELGAGDGTKTAVLIDHFLKQKANFKYSAIDISQEACEELSAKFRSRFPTLDLETRHGDYFQILGSLSAADNRRKILFFLGSNIGNFSRDAAVTFFKSLRGVMNPADKLFIGFDLQKDPRDIVKAYDDAEGVTAAFNLNLLTRINRELGGHFDLGKFSHYAVYRPIECAARSFLISREKQSVRIDALDRSFDFDAWEAIFMEISQKYDQKLIGDLAKESGFVIEQTFYDERHFYCDSLWKPTG